MSTGKRLVHAPVQTRPFPQARPKKLVSAESLFQTVLGRLGYDPDAYAVFEVWDRLLGHQASRARAMGLKGRRLLVEVDSNAHMHDLMLRKRVLLKKLNGHFGTGCAISDIILELSGKRNDSVAERRGRRR